MTFDKVKKIISSELSVDAEKVTLEARLADDLGADSLDATELIMAIEDEFGIEINDEKAQAMKTVKDIVEYIDSNK